MRYFAAFALLLAAATRAAFSPAMTTPVWGECPYDFGVATVCANVSVPRNWDHPADGNISIFVSQVEALTPAPKGTIWFLNGGSGVGGACGPGSGWITWYASKGYNVALPTMRGTGLGVPSLKCPNGTGVPDAACADYYAQTYGAAGMYNFSITMASHDLAYLANTLSQTTHNFLQADSFGTFWAQRFLTVYPDVMSATVLESFDVPGRWSYFEAPNNLDWAARRVMQYCAEDPACGSLAGGGADPYAVLQQVMEDAAAGTLPCNARLPASLGPDFRATYAELLGGLSGGAPREFLGFLPALVYRLARCNADDVAAITHLHAALYPSQGERERAWSSSAAKGTASLQSARVSGAKPAPPESVCDISEPVLYGLFFSEGVPRSLQSLAVLHAHYKKLFASGPTGFFEAIYPVYQAWPRYAVDQYWGRPTATDRQILFFNGDLDAETPWDNAAFSTRIFNKTASQHLVRFPMVPHVAFLNSPLPDTQLTCGLALAMSFYEANGTSFDATCAASIVPLDFVGASNATKAHSAGLFGTDDMWQYDGPAPLRINGNA